MTLISSVNSMENLLKMLKIRVLVNKVTRSAPGQLVGPNGSQYLLDFSKANRKGSNLSGFGKCRVSFCMSLIGM